MWERVKVHIVNGLTLPTYDVNSTKSVVLCSRKVDLLYPGDGTGWRLAGRAVPLGVNAGCLRTATSSQLIHLLIMYSVLVKPLMVREFVVCLNTGSGRLLISDSSAPHYGRRLLRYQKALDNARVEYIYAPVRALPFWKLVLASLIALCFQNILLFTVHVSILDFDRCWGNLWDRRVLAQDRIQSGSLVNTVTELGPWRAGNFSTGSESKLLKTHRFPCSQLSVHGVTHCDLIVSHVTNNARLSAWP
jgi:hypothetical protein